MSADAVGQRGTGGITEGDGGKEVVMHIKEPINIQ